MTKESPRKYTPEFKAEAVKLVIEHGYNQNQAAASLGISSKNINRWVQEREGSKSEKVEKLTADQQEIISLHKQIKKLQIEKEILKKAAAFFASELE
jgi:transposase